MNARWLPVALSSIVLGSVGGSPVWRRGPWNRMRAKLQVRWFVHSIAMLIGGLLIVGPVAGGETIQFTSAHGGLSFPRGDVITFTGVWAEGTSSHYYKVDLYLSLVNDSNLYGYVCTSSMWNGVTTASFDLSWPTSTDMPVGTYWPKLNLMGRVAAEGNFETNPRDFKVGDELYLTIGE